MAPSTTPSPANFAPADFVVVSSSAGKDSEAMLAKVVRDADAQGYPRSKIVVVHADLGRVEWAGTLELAKAQADHYGLRFEVVSRVGRTHRGGGKLYAKGETYGDILEDATRRRFFPASGCQSCTSDFKRAPIGTLYTRLAAEAGHPVVIIEAIGIRAQESAKRAKKRAWELNARASKGARKTVWTWLPILDWVVEDVWTIIRDEGLPHHRAYDLGMSRLSCAFCILAKKNDLIISAIANPELLQAYIDVEREIDFSFKADLSLQDIADAVNAGAQPDRTPSYAGVEGLDVPVCPVCRKPAHASETDDLDRHPECQGAVS